MNVATIIIVASDDFADDVSLLRKHSLISGSFLIKTYDCDSGAYFSFIY